MSATQRHRVVVVGGGFGGLPATRLLSGADVDVTLPLLLLTTQVKVAAPTSPDPKAGVV